MKPSQSLRVFTLRDSTSGWHHVTLPDTQHNCWSCGCACERAHGQEAPSAHTTAPAYLVGLVRLRVGLRALAQANGLVQQLCHGLVVGMVLTLQAPSGMPNINLVSKNAQPRSVPVWAPDARTWVRVHTFFTGMGAALGRPAGLFSASTQPGDCWKLDVAQLH